MRKHTSMASRAILSNFFEEQRTPTTFLEIAVYNKWFRLVRGPAATQANYLLPSRISVAILYKLFAYKLGCLEKRSRLRHVAMVVNFSIWKNLGPANMAEKSENNADMYDFPKLDCTKKQNGSPYVSSIVRQCKWPSLSRKIAEIQKYYYHGNLTSQRPQNSPSMQFATKSTQSHA